MAAPADRRSELVHDRGSTRLSVVETREEAAEELRDWVSGRDVFIVTSAPVWAQHGDATLGRLPEAAASWRVLEVPDGEEAKSLVVAEGIWQSMLDVGARRDSLVLTFGGGSVCDLGAFVASTYMRGLAFSHAPTTLLAQVDAAIGGKSAINLSAAKNTVGVFQHPVRVVAATDLLRTLPPREIRSGLVEIIKVAALLDVGLLDAIETHLESLLADPGHAAWPDLVAAAQRVKVDVVARDALEAGERRVLNFGHTLGHALEAVLGYGALAHGEAVAHGMRFALQLAAGRGLESDCVRRLESILDRLDVPPLPEASVEALLAAVGKDKKVGPEGVIWVLPTALGAWEAVPLPREQVADELGRFMARRRPAC